MLTPPSPEYRRLRREYHPVSPHQPALASLLTPPAADSSGQPHGSTRAPSVRSSRSVSTAMSSLFRRATTTRSNSQESLAQSAVSAPPFDTTSVRSGRQSISLHTKQATQPAITVTSSNLSMRLLRQHSYASMQSETSSATQADAVSMISRRTGHRSMKSRGPPSSFNVRFHDNSPPDEHPHDQATLMAMSSAEIRQEIARVEAEGKRLLDAFSGLELSTMAKQQNRDDPRPGARGLERSPSTWTLVPSDAASGVVPSSSASAVGTPSRKHRLKLNGYRSNDSLRGSSSHLPLPQSRMSTAIPEDGDGPEGEVDDIRRKRDEVRARYERKVEYLHAMLRGAEIREKLAKKKK
ncbi:hypothetical protein EXIGLDRAFT_243737 [Exidia glandulosa HHB12029]|uniref:Uncharacterized protein n=1 Tax=Exidia glandulosa HHB12029 TaxID=1314781 RepID=A0A165Q8M5_EXIGL|nr:hypothetical protein EXIGLDRAFT_243737 [Exidia glandulosa HHB12029]